MMLLIFSYEIRQSRDDEFIVLSSSLVPDRVLAVTCMTSCSLPGLELQCLSTAVRLGGVEVGAGEGEEERVAAKREGSQRGVSVCVSM